VHDVADDGPVDDPAAAEQVSTSALVRRLLRQAVHQHRPGGLTAAEVEDLARRVARKNFTTADPVKSASETSAPTYL